MNTILANVSNSFFVRNILRTDAARVLEEAGARLVLLAPEEKLDYYRNQFPQPWIAWEALPPVRAGQGARLWKLVETSSIVTRTALMLQMADFLRPGTTSAGIFSRTAIFLFRRLVSLAGRLPGWRRILRRLYGLFRSGEFDPILTRLRPDLVFCPSMIYMEDYVLARAARQRGIPVVGMTLSWDNFYSKTLLLIEPERLIVHTDFIARQAVCLGDYPRERIVVSGVPQYDDHFLKRRVSPRGAFIRGLGGDPQKKLILYAMSGKAGLDLDLEILRILWTLCRDGKIAQPVEVLVRPYPRYDFPPQKLGEIRSQYGFIVHASMAHVGQARDDWEFDEEALGLLSNSLAHADVVINMYSTFLIEAAIWDRPLVVPAFDGTLRRSYWNSARRFFDWNHLADIKGLGGVRLVKGEVQFADALNRSLADPSAMREGRMRIAAQQCQFSDGKSGERVGRALAECLSDQSDKPDRSPQLL